MTRCRLRAADPASVTAPQGRIGRPRSPTEISTDLDSEAGETSPSKMSRDHPPSECEANVLDVFGYRRPLKPWSRHEGLVEPRYYSPGSQHCRGARWGAIVGRRKATQNLLKRSIPGN